MPRRFSGILNYARQSVPTFTPGHPLNSRAFGQWGEAVPCRRRPTPPSSTLGLSACSFGQSAIELDTAAGDTLPVLCIVSLKAGRTTGPQAATERENLQDTSLFLPELSFESRSLAARNA